MRRRFVPSAFMTAARCRSGTSPPLSSLAPRAAASASSRRPFVATDPAGSPHLARLEGQGFASPWSFTFEKDMEPIALHGGLPRHGDPRRLRAPRHPLQGAPDPVDAYVLLNGAWAKPPQGKVYLAVPSCGPTSLGECFLLV